jgi:HEPN domain-containing protein
MTIYEALGQAISKLDEKAEPIDLHVKKLLTDTPITRRESGGAFVYLWISERCDETLQRSISRDYQSWYSAAYQLVHSFLPEKESEFVACYEGHQSGVLNFIQLTCYTREGNKSKIVNDFSKRFGLQRDILFSIPSVAEVRVINLRKLISSDFINSELAKADYLFRSGFYRCAGVLAGVALERYLRAFCDLKGVEYKHDFTIEPLSQALYDANKIDQTELKNFQHLGGIRNDCAHPKEVSDEELKGRAKELIEKVKKLSL